MQPGFPIIYLTTHSCAFLCVINLKLDKFSGDDTKTILASVTTSLCTLWFFVSFVLLNLEHKGHEVPQRTQCFILLIESQMLIKPTLIWPLNLEHKGH